MAKLFFCGDISNYTESKDFIGQNIKNIIKDVDYAVCNFEGPEVARGLKANCPHQGAGTADYLNSCGFNLMLLANNHITDLGKEGLQYTIDCIRNSGSDYIGAGMSWDNAYKPIIRNIGGVNVGFMNICEAHTGYYKSQDASYGYAWMGYDNLFHDVAKLADCTDRVVIVVHSGLEHYSIPLPEIRELYHKLCDAGASVIVGGHTHSPQGYEFYNNKLIIYSLGNFYFPVCEGILPEENNSYSVVLDFERTGDIKITPVFHKLEDNIVNEVFNDRINLDYLCKMLSYDYNEQVKIMCNSAWTTTISSLLSYATCGEKSDDSLVHILKI